MLPEHQALDAVGASQLCCQPLVSCLLLMLLLPIQRATHPTILQILSQLPS
jgi:hypothetical protein